MRDNMAGKLMTSSRWFMVVLACSLILAMVGWLAPRTRMPLNFHYMIWGSLPLAGIWLLMVIISAFRFLKKALWLLIGAPLALYWPVWLLVNGIPACYWNHNCV
jgi:hypothetical protein